MRNNNVVTLKSFADLGVFDRNARLAVAKRKERERQFANELVAVKVTETFAAIYGLPSAGTLNIPRKLAVTMRYNARKALTRGTLPLGHRNAYRAMCGRLDKVLS